MSYPYVQAKYDYGPRKGPTLGLVLHMTEGNGTMADVLYLAHDPARGVSANFVALADGTIYQMLDIEHASGSLKPGDISTANKPYYAGHFLTSVLPDPLWRDPNSHVISIEIGGKAADGPTEAQIAAVTVWAADMRSRFPSIVGAFGHADQTDEKPCPGDTLAMQSIFDAIGGHGLFAENPNAGGSMYDFDLRSGPPVSLVLNGDGHYYLDLSSQQMHGPLLPSAFGTKSPAYPITLKPPLAGGAPGADRATAYLIGTNAAAILASDVTTTPLSSEDFATGYAAAKADAIAAVSSIAPKP